MPGRKKNKCFDELHFELINIKNKYFALCLYCKKNLTNTAASRLQAHRNICKIAPDSEFESSSCTVPDEQNNLKDIHLYPISSDNPENNTISETTETWECMEILEDGTITPVKLINSNQSSKVSIEAETSENKCSHTPISTAKSIKRRKRITDYMDMLHKDEENELNEALASFFFGCNIPLSTIDSPHFKNFISKLRPAYSPKLPGRHALSTTLLDKTYDKLLEKSRKTIKEHSVLLIDGWKNSSSNTKTVVSMIHCTDGTQTFLNAWDLSLESETGEKLAEP